MVEAIKRRDCVYHFRMFITRGNKHMRKSKIDKNIKWFEETVKKSKSISELVKNLGYKYSGGAHLFVKNKLIKSEIDYSHMIGRGWALGKTWTARKAKPLSELMSKDLYCHNQGSFKRRLIKEGILQNKCYNCGIDTWL